MNKMSAAQMKTLATLIRMGGKDVDITYAVKGVYSLSLPVLYRAGLIDIRQESVENRNYPNEFATVTADGIASVA